INTTFAHEKVGMLQNGILNVIQNEQLNSVFLEIRDFSTKFRLADNLGEWNMMLHGEVAPSDQKQWLETLEQTFAARETARYVDANTESRSYFSSKLNTSIGNGSNIMNLQVAIHNDST